MPYLDALVNEMLRLYPTISTTARLFAKPVELTTSRGPVTIPAGAHLYSSIYLRHRDERIWDPM
ncbi:hypothetical protein BDY21DRAFT_353410 [Lineolata rhizophorae]|uniref:Cytochrome P450 n=1 Tax=Lineolata rhizophorae TaxID=578093 RepID=A0A6A6NR81_9PEZI|nr:hypothetical protein BDY21DRAFT_353410 [Lineolata rhizophorae]